jgi:ABC-type multidrug transport system fused ATPase/permease subunit
VERGTHETLLTQKGVYSRLHDEFLGHATGLARPT